ncbi:expressed protein [Phakopsora pachyrhizi]|uniref:Expressed protein n=1 Tax=Phakopsora pachyrhizi TaxID=170000 RepID=A0AAV0B025_PHAPC|nr:expressed protein [Phakopsora pachyrhizi]
MKSQALSSKPAPSSLESGNQMSRDDKSISRLVQPKSHLTQRRVSLAMGVDKRINPSPSNNYPSDCDSNSTSKIQQPQRKVSAINHERSTSSITRTQPNPKKQISSSAPHSRSVSHHHRTSLTATDATREVISRVNYLTPSPKLSSRQTITSGALSSPSNQSQVGTRHPHLTSSSSQQRRSSSTNFSNKQISSSSSLSQKSSSSKPIRTAHSTGQLFTSTTTTSSPSPSSIASQGSSFTYNRSSSALNLGSANSFSKNYDSPKSPSLVTPFNLSSKQKVQSTARKNAFPRVGDSSYRIINAKNYKNSSTDKSPESFTRLRCVSETESLRTRLPSTESLDDYNVQKTSFRRLHNHPLGEDSHSSIVKARVLPKQPSKASPPQTLNRPKSIIVPSNHNPCVEPSIDSSTSDLSTTLTSASNVQYRLSLLKSICDLVGSERYNTLIDNQTVKHLISQSSLYETQEELFSWLERAQGSGEASSGTEQCEDETCSSLTPSQSTTLDAPFTSLVQKSSQVSHPSETLESNPRKGSAKILELLGWKLKPTSLKPFKASQIEDATSKKENSNCDQSRKSMVLGAQLQSMDRSTCFVIMGKRIHVLPKIIFSAIEEIYGRGMRTPGILRISGDLNRVDALVSLYENCPTAAVDLSGEQIHTLCGLVKQYLRALPEPLFHSSFSKLFWSVCVEPERGTLKEEGLKLDSESQDVELSTRLLTARLILRLLPSRFCSLFIYVVSFLAQIPLFAENRVQKESLAAIFGPATFAPREVGIPGLSGYHSQYPSQRASTLLKGRECDVRSRRASINTLSATSKDKLDASMKATECMLWILKHWVNLIDVALSDDDSDLNEKFHQANPQQISAGYSNCREVTEQVKDDPPSSPAEIQKAQRKQVQTDKTNRQIQPSKSFDFTSSSIGQDTGTTYSDLTPPLSPPVLSSRRSTSADSYNTHPPNSPTSSEETASVQTRVWFPSHSVQINESRRVEYLERYQDRRNEFGMIGSDVIIEEPEKELVSECNHIHGLMTGLANAQKVKNGEESKDGPSEVLRVLTDYISQHEEKLDEQVELNKRLMAEVKQLRLTSEANEREVIKVKEELLEREQRLAQYELDVGKLLLGKIRLLDSSKSTDNSTMTQSIGLGLSNLTNENNCEAEYDGEGNREKEDQRITGFINSNCTTVVKSILIENDRMKEEVEILRKMNCEMSGRLEAVKIAADKFIKS